MLRIGVVSAWKEIEYIWGALQDKTRTTTERKIVVHKKLLAAYHKNLPSTSTGSKYVRILVSLSRRASLLNHVEKCQEACNTRDEYQQS